MQTYPQSLPHFGLRGLALIAALAAGAAQAKDLDSDTRNYVIANCSTDAYRLCPQALTSEQAAVSCMKAKRRELGSSCRVAYDKVARILAQ